MSSTKPDINQILGVGGNTGKRKRKVGRLFFLIILIAVAGAAYWRFTLMKEAPGRPMFVTQPVVKGDLVVTVTATGDLEPTNEVEVGSELSGIVRKVTVEENDHVTAGQVLLELDQSKFKAQVMQSRAALQSAEAQILQAKATTAEAKSNLARYQALHKLSGGKAPSKYDLEAAEATLQRGPGGRGRGQGRRGRGQGRPGDRGNGPVQNHYQVSH